MYRYISILFLLLINSNYSNGSIVKVHLEIQGQDVNVVSFLPSSDIFFDPVLFKKLPTIKGESNFDFSFELPISTFLTLHINNELNLPYVLSPGDSISVRARRIMNANYPKYEYKLGGSNQIAEEIYLTRFYPPGKLFGFFAELANSTNDYSSYYIKACHYIDSLTKVWDSLLTIKSISTGVYELFKADTKGILFNEAIKKIANVKTDSSWKSYSKYFNLRDLMFFHADASNKILLNTPFGSAIYQRYLTAMLKEDDLVKDSLLKTADLGFYYYFDDSYREDSWGNFLWMLKKLFPNGSAGDTRELEVFKSYYPKSIYYKNITNFQDSIIKERQSLGGNVKINVSPVDSLKNIFKSNDGRYFFIDVWATWCKPCIQEFNYYTGISRFLSNKQIKEVFFSIDRLQDKEYWVSFINKQNLSGEHFILTENAQKQLLLVLSKDFNQSALSIPRYLLYDKKEDKYYIDLPRPSSGIVLESFLENIVNKQ